MAYDAADGYVVLFGGTAGSGYFADTWAFSGGQWRQLHPTVVPPGRGNSQMSYDAQDGYGVLFGGYNSSLSYMNDTWEFKAGQWSQVTTVVAPGPRVGAGMTYDAADKYVVLFGGNAYGAPTYSDTWSFTLGKWSNLDISSGPTARGAPSMTYDAADGYVLLFGGSNGTGALNDTWEFKAGQWTRLFPTVSPSARSDALMTYDTVDGYVLLFGGASASGVPLGDTWEFKGGQWTQLHPASSPSARSQSVMAYDAADGYVVLFGGTAGSGYFADTWAFSGGQWRQLHPTVVPPGRGNSQMSYDAQDGYGVLFGGYNSSLSYMNDTWEFKAGQWSQVTTVVAPGPRVGAGMTYDAADKYVVLFGGNDLGSPTYADTWAFRGGTWQELNLGISPSIRGYPAMTFDIADNYALLFGGHGTTYYSDTWSFGMALPPIGLVGVSISPSSGILYTAGNVTLTALPTCSSGPCPSSVAFLWSVSPLLGIFNSTIAKVVSFKAGNSPGNVSIGVNATLNGTQVSSMPAFFTISLPPAKLTSVRITPSSVSVVTKGQVNLNATPSCQGGPCPTGIIYSWSLNNTVGSLGVGSGSSVTFTAGSSPGTTLLTVAASSNGVNVYNTSAITVYSANDTLTSVTISPGNVAIDEGSNQTFTANPACAQGPCPTGVTFNWSLNTSSLGTLSTGTGRVTMFHAANQQTGVVSLIVSATFGSVLRTNATSIRILSPSSMILSSTSIVPASITIVVGSTANFTAISTCTGGACPSGIEYRWSLTNSLAHLESSQGGAAVILAGSTSGSVVLDVEASLQGHFANASSTITIKSKSNNPNGSTGTPLEILGVSGVGAYLLILIVGVVVGVVAVLLLLRRKKLSNQKRPPPDTQHSNFA
jgi:hypothetical protein